MKNGCNKSVCDCWFNRWFYFNRINNSLPCIWVICDMISQKFEFDSLWEFSNWLDTKESNKIIKIEVTIMK